MRFHKEIRFPGSLDEVVAMLSDVRFREQVATAASPGRHQCSVTPHGNGFTAVVDSVNSTEGLPSAATKFLGSSYRIRQEEDWISATRGNLHVTIPGKPGSVRGTVSLREGAGEVVQTVEADVKVAIPFIGGKIEPVIGRVLGHVLRLQEQVGGTWLAS